MKQTITLFFASLFATIAVAQRTPYSTKEFNAASISRAQARTSGGNITVKATTDEKARVEVFIQSPRRNNELSKEEITARLEKYYELTIALEGDRLVAKAERRDQRWDNKTALSISFDLYLPARVATNLSTSGGNIRVTGTEGEQSLTTSGGNIELADIRGKVKGVTSGGNIVVHNSSDEVELTTSGGNIESTNCKGKLGLTTSGGSILLRDLDGKINANTSGGNVEAYTVKGDLRAHTSGGNVKLTGISGDLVAGTSGGNIEVTIKDATSSVRLSNNGGNISLSLPAGKGYDLDLNARKIRMPHLSNFTGNTGDDQIVGKVNGGGAKISVDGHDGTLVLNLD